MTEDVWLVADAMPKRYSEREQESSPGLRLG
jgi:hypothetical protein